MTKTKLFTAASAAAILLAGAAQAGDITGTVGGVTFNDATTYTVVEEKVISEDAPLAGSLVLNYLPEDGIDVAAGSSADYRLTFTITGGEFATPTSATLAVDFAGTAASAGVTNGLRNATTLTYIVNVEGGATLADTIDAMTASGAGLTLESAADVSVSATLELLAGGVPSTIDTASVDVVDYASIFDELTANASDAEATLPNFTTFGSDDNADLGDVDFAVTGSLYSDLSGTGATADAITDSYTLVLTGGQFDELQITAGGNDPEEGFTASSAEFEFTTLAALNAAEVNVANADEVRIQPNDYSASVVIDYATGFSGDTSYGPVDLGSVTLEGTNFIAPWISGSQAQTQSTIRLSNTGSAAANVTLRITNGVFNFNGSPTNFNDADCSLGQLVLPAAGDLVITPAVMTQCFGAFTRGDLLITVEAEASVITAKVRNSNASGAFETSLGRYSGTSSAPN